jgi:hypothetical protein
MVSALCALYNVQSGEITIACNNISALQNSLEDLNAPRISKAEHDLLYAIKKKLSGLPINYQLHHVKGHKDDVRPAEELDRWSLLNIEMDNLAKSMLQHWSENPLCQQIEGEPWSVWSQGWKLINDLDSTIYEAAHSYQIKHYWVQKQKFPIHHAGNIHWEALQTAMKESKLARKTFITKHASGMCGVGKFMKRWGERETDACLRCGEHEDAAHVWLCSQTQAQEVWTNSLTKLQLWMEEVGT